MEAVTIGCGSLSPLLRNVGVGKFPPMNSHSSFDRMLHKLTCRQNTPLMLLPLSDALPIYSDVRFAETALLFPLRVVSHERA